MLFPSRETNVGLWYFRGYLGIEWQAADKQSVEAMNVSEDPVSTASLKVMFPAAMVA